MLPYLVISLLAMLAIVQASLTMGHPNIRISPYVTLAPLILITTLVAGFRYQTGGDWQTYEEWYSGFSFDSILTFGVEPGWIAYSLLLRQLGLNFDLYLLATSVLSNYLIWRGLSQLLCNKRAAIICFGFYCLIVFYSAQMFYIRAGVATGLFLSAIAASRQHKLRAAVLLLLAISIHSAAILAAFIYVCLRFCTRNRLLLGTSVLALAVLFWLVSQTFLPPVYLEGEFSDPRALNLKSAIGLLLFGTIIARLPRFREQYSPEVTAVCIAALSVPYMFESFEVGGRVRMFFSPIDGLPIYFLVLTMVGRRNTSIPLLFASSVFVLIYWTNPYTLEIFSPYQTWVSRLF